MSDAARELAERILAYDPDGTKGYWQPTVNEAVALLSSYAQSERNKALLELMEEIRLAIGHVTLNRQGWAPMERYLAVIESRRDELAAAIRESK